MGLHGLLNVDVGQGNLLDLTVDALVRPTHSSGFLDSSIDLVYSWRFQRHARQCPNRTLHELVQQLRLGDRESQQQCFMIRRTPHLFILRCPLMCLGKREVASLKKPYWSWSLIDSGPG